MNDATLIHILLSIIVILSFALIKVISKNKDSSVFSDLNNLKLQNDELRESKSILQDRVAHFMQQADYKSVYHDRHLLTYHLALRKLYEKQEDKCLSKKEAEEKKAFLDKDPALEMIKKAKNIKKSAKVEKTEFVGKILLDNVYDTGKPTMGKKEVTHD